MRSSAQQKRARDKCREAHTKTDDLGREYMDCHLCPGRIYLGIDKWDADHVVAVTFGGSDEAAVNVRPAHESCHAVKTAKDITANAKAKRVRDKHLGIIKKGDQWRSRKGFRYDWGTCRYVRTDQESD